MGGSVPLGHEPFKLFTVPGAPQVLNELGKGGLLFLQTVNRFLLIIVEGRIPAGTEVASHYVFFDSFSGVHIGYVDFDAPVLGIAAFQDTMGATDFLANTKVTYIGSELRGLEQGDAVWIDETEPTRIWVYWAGSSPGDYIRVFTERSLGALMM